MRGVLILIAFLLAGCVTPGQDLGAASVEPAIEQPAFAQEHDHADPTLHTHAQGLRLVGIDSLDADDVPRGDWLTSEVIVRGDYAYVAYIGAPWLVAIVDIRDATAPKVVGRWATTNAWGMDIAVSDDGDWVYVAIYPGAVGTIYDQRYAIEHLTAPSGPALPGVAVVDARDRSAPVLSSFLPMHSLGPHTLVYHRYPDGAERIFLQKADVQVGNAVEIVDVIATPAGPRILRPMSVFSNEDPLSTMMPHDVDVQEHPITGQTLLYIAYTWDGVVIVDVTDPASPKKVSQSGGGDTSDPEALVHDVHPYGKLVDGRHYTIATPEIPSGDTSGTLRVYDTTDPTAPTFVGSWKMPGDYVTDEPFQFSTHNFQYMPDGKVALAHGHAGVWLVDWLSTRGLAPTGTAYYAAAQPDAVPPSWSPVSGTPWFWGTAIDERGVLWASDSMGGLLSLAED